MTVTQPTALSKICARLVAAAEPGTRLPSVRELTARHHASPVTVAEAIRQLVAAGPGRDAARPGHLRGRRAGPTAAHPTCPGRPSRSAPRRPGRGGDAGAAGAAARRRDPAVRRLPGRGPAARRRARRRAGPRRPAARVLAARAGRGARGPARLVRPRGRRRAARRRHGDLPGRAGRAVDGAARAGRARRHRCSSSRRPTWARWPPPGRPGCGWCRCPPTPTACGPTSSPPRSPAPAHGCSTASRCTPTRTARRWPAHRRAAGRRGGPGRRARS